jgi:hypothetical protein
MLAHEYGTREGVRGTTVPIWDDRTQILTTRKNGRKKKKGKVSHPTRLHRLRQPDHLKGSRSGIFGRVWLLIGAVSVVVSIVAAVYTFQPRVSVGPSATLDASDPLASRFFVRNDSYYNLEHVGYSCNVSDLGRWRVTENQVIKSYHVELAHPIPTLQPEESMMIDCINMALPYGPPERATIDIMVNYRLPLVRLERKSTFRFSTLRSSEGKVVWLPQATSEDDLRMAQPSYGR